MKLLKQCGFRERVANRQTDLSPEEEQTRLADSWRFLIGCRTWLSKAAGRH